MITACRDMAQLRESLFFQPGELDGKLKPDLAVQPGVITVFRMAERDARGS
jgi:hypothetical protein